MSRMLRVHPRSVVVGSGIATLLFVCLSQTSAPTFPTARVEVGPHPRDMVQIVGTAPYTVPAGKILTLTAIGADVPFPGNLTLFINGQPALMLGGTGNMSVAPIPSCLTAQWGSTVALAGLGPSGPVPRAWGYLADR